MRKEADVKLAALTQELRVALFELNRLHHPVYPAPAEQVEQAEADVAEIKAAIQARKAELKAAV